jgi:hypothetical protein
MTDKTDKELIAEFIGFQIVSENPVIKGIVCHGRTWKAPVEKDLPYWGGFRAEQLHKFETSWDWLMPVVEKIDQCYSLVGGLTDDYCARYEKVENAITNNYSITEAYQAVVEFIKWYNSQKS